MVEEAAPPAVPTAIVTLVLIYTILGPVGLVPVVIGILVLLILEALHVFNNTVDQYNAIQDELQRLRQEEHTTQIVATVEQKLALKYQAAVTELNDQIDNLNDGHQEQINSLNSEIVELDAKVEELDDKNVALSIDVKEMQAKIVKLEHTESATEAKLLSLQRDNAKLSDKIRDLEKNETATTTKLAALQNVNDRLSDKIADLEKNEKATKEDLRALQSEKSKLLTEITGIEFERISLSRQNQTLTIQNQTLSREKTTLEGQVQAEKEDVHRATLSQGAAGPSTAVRPPTVAGQSISAAPFNAFKEIVRTSPGHPFAFPACDLETIQPLARDFCCVGTNEGERRKDLRCGWYSMYNSSNTGGFRPEHKREAITILEKMRSNDPGSTLEYASLELLATRLLCPARHSTAGTHSQTEKVARRWYNQLKPARDALSKRQLLNDGATSGTVQFQMNSSFSPASAYSTPPATPDEKQYGLGKATTGGPIQPLNGSLFNTAPTNSRFSFGGSPPGGFTAGGSAI